MSKIPGRNPHLKYLADYREAYEAASWGNDFAANPGPRADAALVAYADAHGAISKAGYATGGEVVVEATQRNERRPGWGIRLAAASAVVTLALSTAGAYALDRTQNGSSTSGSASNESASSSSVLVNNTSPWENQGSDNAQLRIVATDGNGPYESTWGVEEAGGFSYGDGSYLLDGGSVPYSIPSGVYPMAGVETKPDLDNPNDFGVEFTSRPITAEVVAKAGELATVVFDFANGSAKTIYTPEQPIPQSQGRPGNFSHQHS